MGELVAWGLGLCLGYAVRNSLTTFRRIVFFVVAILLIGALITLSSGEIFQEPWLVLLDVAQVAAAALIGLFAIPFCLRQLLRLARPEVR